ncbi:MAG TPA: branched-chain-amino-acid transaminase [Armatimonadota bacterium]|jgi:branched-chain amino acid aminotransferase
MAKSNEQKTNGSDKQQDTEATPVMYLDGKMVPVAEARLSVLDHGFLYGDGLFEGIRAYGGKVWKLDEHLDRLYNGAHVLMIDLPITKRQMRDAIRQTLRANGLSDAYIRVTVTRGIGLGLDPKNIANPTVAIMTSKLSLYPVEMYEHGLEVVTVSSRVPRPDSLEVRVKSTGKYVANIQAKLEANRQGAGEGLLLNGEGYVAEATGDNIFIIRGGRIMTPPASAGILEGITRATAIEIANTSGYRVEEMNLSLFDVYTADEAFLTGTGAEMISMCKLDGRLIGNGKPGPITKKLIAKFRARTKSEGVPIED